MKKILILQNGQYFGGAERALLNFLEYTNEKEKFEIYSFEKRDYLKYFEDIGIEVNFPNPVVLRIGEFFYKNLKGGWVLQELLRALAVVFYVFQSRFSRVHVNMAFKYMNFHLSLIKLSQTKISIHIRSLIAQVRLSDSILKKCDKCICVSDCVAQQYRKVYPHDADKFFVIYDGVYPADGIFFADRSADHFIFLAPAVLDHRKGVDVVITAFHEFIQVNGSTEATLLIAGTSSLASTNYYQYLVELVSDLKLKDRVIFLGHVEDMRSLYQRANVVLMLSRDGEALGLVGIEAHIMSCLLIAPNYGAIGEYLTDMSTGLVVTHIDPRLVAEKMTYAYINWSHTRQIRVNAFEGAVQKFSVEKTSEELLSFFMGKNLTKEAITSD